MKKEEKEKIISEVRLKEIESLDRDTTSMVFKGLAVWGAIFVYFYKVGFNPTIIYSLGFLLLYLLWYQYQSYKYICDCYNWLSQSIEQDKILTESPPDMTIFDAFYYKKKYLQESNKLKEEKMRKINDLEIAITGIKISLAAIVITLIGSILPGLLSKFSETVKSIAEWLVLIMAVIVLYYAWKINPKQVYKK